MGRAHRWGWAAPRAILTRRRAEAARLPAAQAVAAQVSAWVQCISPVAGCQQAMEEVDPALVDNPNIFPSDADLAKAFVFMELSPEKSEEYTRAFEKAIGN